MPGFSNTTVYAHNVDFTGNVHVQPQMLLDGQLLIGATVFPNIRVATLTPGAGIGITNGAGTITIDAVGGGFSWHETTSITNPTSLVTQNGYIAKGAPVVQFLLPAAASVGDTFKIVGHGNLWTLKQNALQTISLGALTSTPGVTGALTATQIKDTIEIVCVTTNLEFQVVYCIGNPDIT
jgi:hypothetical protein